MDIYLTKTAATIHNRRVTDGRILLTGATGYIGGRLLQRLQQRRVAVRCLARRPDALASRVAPATEVVQGDLLDPASLSRAFEGVHTAYYLVHSMGSGPEYDQKDKRAAAAFGEAARRAGVRRVIYLGGLADASSDLSPHLRSRLETGDTLRRSGVPVVEFRASIVVGAGSLSFEMIRALVERLPVMVCPRWVRTPAQPIGIDDLLAYLEAALLLPDDGASRVFEIGGADRASYGDLMREYARQRSLRRWLIAVPLLTPRLSGLWLGLVTPVYARVGRELVLGLRNASVVRDPAALTTFGIRPMGMRAAVARAIAADSGDRETSWFDARSSARAARDWSTARLGRRLTDTREARVDVSAARAFAPIRRIGGAQGWYYAGALWRVRGWLDLLVGGVGLRRGRRHPEEPRVGDALDFWRVEAYDPAGRLRLSAEMRLPGRAWLEFEVTPDRDGAVIRQTAIFDPAGLAGYLYWYAIHPLHALVFRGMLRRIARAAESGAPAGTPRLTRAPEQSR